MEILQCKNDEYLIPQEFIDADNDVSLDGSEEVTHSGAIYSSRSMKFDGLTEPKNSHGTQVEDIETPDSQLANLTISSI